MPGFSTIHQIFALHHFIDEARSVGQSLYTCFFDLKVVYDRVQRPLLWQALQRLSLHGQMLAAIQSRYHDSKLAVHINGAAGQTYIFYMGVKQGCPLSPALFGWPSQVSPSALPY